MAARRPVLTRPSWRVENSPGSRLIIFSAGGGGRIIESMAWITPLVPNLKLSGCILE